MSSPSSPLIIPSQTPKQIQECSVSRTSIPSAPCIPPYYPQNARSSVDESEEPNDEHEVLRGCYDSQCSSAQDCSQKTEHILKSLQPSGTKRSAQDLSDYSPRSSTENVKHTEGLRNFCPEYAGILEFLDTPSQRARLEYHEASLTVPKDQSPAYYKYMARLVKEGYGTIATYMACCKHDHFIWTKMGHENMHEGEYRVNCRICNHSYTSPDGKVCTECMTQKVLEEWDYEGEWGMPFEFYTRALYTCSGEVLDENLFRTYFWVDEDGVWKEWYTENLDSVIGM